MARGASFNTKALTELITQAVEHKGFSYIDAMSPCTTFNNTQESWKDAVTDVAPDHDPTDRVGALNLVQSRAAQGELVTGLLYVDPDPEDLHRHLGTVEQPLASLGARELCPGQAALDRINASLR